MWWKNRWPDEDDAKAFNRLGITLMRFGVVVYFGMYLDGNVDDGGCGDPYCCGEHYETCEVEVKMHDGTYEEYTIYDSSR
jgi:hypothetical protein